MTKADFTGRTVLITGASGYLGSSLTHLLAERGARIVRVSRKAPLPLQGAVDIVADVREAHTWHGLLNGVDAVMHLAGMTSVNEAEARPVESLRANVLPMLHLLEECDRSRARPFIANAGTSTVVGLPASTRVNESFEDDPITVYDLHKLLAERHLLHACRVGRAVGCSLRLGNVYGPSPAQSASPDRGVLNKVAQRVRAGEPVIVFGDGGYLRDYVYITDVAEAFLAAAAGDPARTSGRYFLVASGQGTTLREAFSLVVETGARMTGCRVALSSAPWPDNLSPIERRNYFADVSAFSEATGWSPAVSLERGIGLMLEAAQ